MKTKSSQIKLNDMGTTGLVNWVVSGSRRMRGARLGKAKKIIAARTRRWESLVAFCKCVNQAVETAEAAREQAALNVAVGPIGRRGIA